MVQVQFSGEHLIELAQDSNYVHSQQHAVFAESTKYLSSHKLYLESHSGKACLGV